jgi:hypothetical protein
MLAIMTSSFLRLNLYTSMVCAGLFSSTLGAAAGPLQVALLPVEIAPPVPVSFWGQPYPYGYVYRRPQLECWAPRRVDSLFGSREELVWVCDNSVTARY